MQKFQQPFSLRPTLLLALMLASGAADARAAKPAKMASKQVADAEAPQYVGILIDRFMIRDLRPAEGTKVRLSFSLYVEVEEADAKGIGQLLETNKHRIRNEVLVAIRTSEQHEFQEPGLDRLRRRCLLRLRRTVPALKAHSLLIGEFEFFND